MKPLLLLLATTALFAQTETISNGIKIRTQETTEGLTVFVVPSGCNVEAIRVRLVGSQPGAAFTVYSDIKGVTACDRRPVEFRFDKPGEVSFIGVSELAKVNEGSAK